MAWQGLVVDLDSPSRVSEWQSEITAQQYPLEFFVCDSKAAAKEFLASKEITGLFVIAAEFSEEVIEILRDFQNHCGPFAEFQGIVCSEPSAKYTASALELGVEQFLAKNEWVFEGLSIINKMLETLSNVESVEYKTLHLNRLIAQSDQAGMQKAEELLKDYKEYDFRAAFTIGRANEASGNYEAAITAFKSAAGMNQLFRPSNSNLGESLLTLGRIDEAIAVYENLEKTNPYSIERKAILAAAYAEKGDLEKADAYVKAAEQLNPNSKKVVEAKAQIFLGQGKIGEAFKLLDELSDVGPYFAVKLNAMGIKLSQSGKGQSALSLYQKAHKIVRQELRYKISLNAALACRRLKSYKLALQYIDRCKKEYGGDFPKLEKIRVTLMTEMKAEAANVDKAS